MERRKWIPGSGSQGPHDLWFGIFKRRFSDGMFRDDEFWLLMLMKQTLILMIEFVVFSSSLILPWGHATDYSCWPSPSSLGFGEDWNFFWSWVFVWSRESDDKEWLRIRWWIGETLIQRRNKIPFGENRVDFSSSWFSNVFLLLLALFLLLLRCLNVV